MRGRRGLTGFGFVAGQRARLPSAMSISPPTKICRVISYSQLLWRKTTPLARASEYTSVLYRHGTRKLFTTASLSGADAPKEPAQLLRTLRRACVMAGCEGRAREGR